MLERAQHGAQPPAVAAMRHAALGVVRRQRKLVAEQLGLLFVFIVLLLLLLLLFVVAACGGTGADERGAKEEDEEQLREE